MAQAPTPKSTKEEATKRKRQDPSNKETPDLPELMSCYKTSTIGLPSLVNSITS